MKNRNRNFNNSRHYIWIFLKYLFLIGILSSIVLLLLLGSSYQDFKSATRDGLNAKTALISALSATKTQNWSQAAQKAQEAEIDFSQAEKTLQKSRSNFTVKHLKIINSQVKDLDSLFSSGEILSHSLRALIPLAQNLDQIRSLSNQDNFQDLSTANKDNFLKTISSLGPELKNLKISLDLANSQLATIHHFGILWPLYQQIQDIRTKLTASSQLITNFSPLIKLLPAFSGTPETSRFLIILQNNDELRPSGGFIGVDAILEIKNGAIISLKTDDSYHLDMPASQSPKWNLKPPIILEKYLRVKKWYLRDANWSPDWPQSARKVVEIYNGESKALNKPTSYFTGIIAITPNLIADLIKFVGPLQVQGTTYQANDFQQLLQYNVEVAYKKQHISSWDRKEVVNNLMNELKLRLYQVPLKNWGNLLNIVEKNIVEKNIQIYFFNPNWENLAQKLQATGEIIKTNHDFLMVVDANLVAFKSDAVMKKDMTYTVLNKNGEIQANLQLNYQHQGKFNWRTTRYRSYTRIYVPLGSHLLSITGLQTNIANISTENNLTLGKTVFGFFFIVEPGNSRQIIIKYSLPKIIKQEIQDKDYQLLVEKQAGRRVNSLIVNLQFEPQENQHWSTTLNKNQVFKLNASP